MFTRSHYFRSRPPPSPPSFYCAAHCPCPPPPAQLDRNVRLSLLSRQRARQPNRRQKLRDHSSIRLHVPRQQLRYEGRQLSRKCPCFAVVVLGRDCRLAGGLSVHRARVISGFLFCLCFAHRRSLVLLLNNACSPARGRPSASCKMHNKSAINKRSMAQHGSQPNATHCVTQQPSAGIKLVACACARTRCRRCLAIFEQHDTQGRPVLGCALHQPTSDTCVDMQPTTKVTEG